MDVADLCPEIVGVEDTSAQSHVAALCQAWYLSSHLGRTVVVVSNDAGVGGGRISMAEACRKLGLQCNEISDLLVAQGASGCLV